MLLPIIFPGVSSDTGTVVSTGQGSIVGEIRVRDINRLRLS